MPSIEGRAASQMAILHKLVIARSYYTRVTSYLPIYYIASLWHLALTTQESQAT